MADAELVAKWRDRVERSRSSGLSVADFCRAEGFSTATYYSWRRRLSDEQPGGENVALEFVEVGAEGAGAAVEIAFGSGTFVRVGAGFDATTLRRVLDVLRDRS